MRETPETRPPTSETTRVLLSSEPWDQPSSLRPGKPTFTTAGADGPCPMLLLLLLLLVVLGLGLA